MNKIEALKKAQEIANHENLYELMNCLNILEDEIIPNNIEEITNYESLKEIINQELFENVLGFKVLSFYLDGNSFEYTLPSEYEYGGVNYKTININDFFIKAQNWITLQYYVIEQNIYKDYVYLYLKKADKNYKELSPRLSQFDGENIIVVTIEAIRWILKQLENN